MNKYQEQMQKAKIRQNNKNYLKKAAKEFANGNTGEKHSLIID